MKGQQEPAKEEEQDEIAKENAQAESVFKYKFGNHARALEGVNSFKSVSGHAFHFWKQLP